MFRNKYIFFILCALAILEVIPSIKAETNTIDIIPIEDTYIEKYQSSVNFGSSDSLMVMAENEYDDELADKTYLKFDLSDLSSVDSIVSSELKLYLAVKQDVTSAIDVFYCSNNWEELVINWDNAPNPESIPVDTCYSVAFEGWYSWDVTSAVNRALSTGTLTLVLQGKENSGISLSIFHSKDSAYLFGENTIPRLTVTYTGTKINEDNSWIGKDSTPGFEILFVLCAIALLLILKGKKRRK